MTVSRARTLFTPGTPLPDHWFHILLALADDSRHGLGIIQEVAAQTDGRVQVWPGMLYLALKRMNEEGLVVGTEAPEGFVGRYVVARLLSSDGSVEVLGIGRSPRSDDAFTHSVRWAARRVVAPLPDAMRSAFGLGRDA